MRFTCDQTDVSNSVNISRTVWRFNSEITLSYAFWTCYFQQWKASQIPSLNMVSPRVLPRGGLRQGFLYPIFISALQGLQTLSLVYWSTPIGYWVSTLGLLWRKDRMNEIKGEEKHSHPWVCSRYENTRGGHKPVLPVVFSLTQGTWAGGSRFKRNPDCYPCGNFSDTSSWTVLRLKGSIGHAFTVCNRTENQNQASFSPFGPHEISVLIELTLGHLRYHLTDVPPQPNSPPDTVSCVNCSNKNHFNPESLSTRLSNHYVTE